MNNTQQAKQIMHPINIKVKQSKRRYKPNIQDAIYLFLCILIIIGFSDNVERFVSANITPKVIMAQTRIENAKRVLFNEQIISPLGTQLFTLPMVRAANIEVKNPFNPKSPKGIAWTLNKSMFGIEHWAALEELITNESGWNPYAVNKSSGACGIGQALPCSKMNCEQWDYECQTQWTLDYIKDRYDNPSKAWEFWQEPHLIEGEYVHYY